VNGNLNFEINSIANLVLEYIPCRALCGEKERTGGISGGRNTACQCLKTDFLACRVIQSRCLSFSRKQNAFWLAFFSITRAGLVDIEQ
jgi:hypothetical protein